MFPDNPGIWMFHCHVSDHMTGGMMTHYQVLEAKSPGREAKPTAGK
jgi:hephaestin